ncbi:MAG: hypothetical protein M1514_03475 [Patescibacteria group bacterium]|nr:hypothetical protein [Patescibacteria group bacterium]
MKKRANSLWHYFCQYQAQFLLLTMLLVFIFMLKQGSYLVFLGLNFNQIFWFYWLIVIIALRLPSYLSLVITILLLIVDGIFFAFKSEGWSIRTSNYVFTFSSLAILQSWFEFFYQKRKKHKE